MALRAIRPQLAFMRILVAAGAVLRKSQIRIPQVLHLDRRFCGWLDMRGRMALTALEPRVLSLQSVSRLIVIELLERRLPVNQRKVFAIVFGVARRAIRLIRKSRVQPAPARELRRDLLVALLALQFRRALPHHMATRAVCWPAQ